MQLKVWIRILLVPLLAIAMVSLGHPSISLAQDDEEAEESGGRRSARNWDINTPHTGGRPVQLDAHIGFAWWGLGLGTGLRLGIPLGDNGFIPDINNAVYLNFGADFYFVDCGGGGRCGGNDYGFGLGFPVTLHWEFYFSEHWSAYGEIGFQIFLHPRLFAGDQFGVHNAGYWFVFAVGGTYRFNENIGITVRLGIPYAVVGLQFEFG